MIVHHIYDTFHALLVNGADQLFEILHGSILRVDLTVVLISIRASKLAFSGLLADRMNRHKPDDIHAQIFYTIQILLDCMEGSFFTMITYINRIHYLVAKHFLCVLCH
ncbi:hypothetical protein D3C76_1480570 [compost metagenome]